MAPARRKRLRAAEEAQMEAQGMAACDSERQEERGLSGPEGAPEVDLKQALLAKRKKLEMDAEASIKTANEKIDRVWKRQREQRQNLHLRYSQRFQTLFREWDIDVQKAQEREEKLANMLREQRKSLQQARMIQKQKLKKIKNLCEQFLKSMEELEKDHERLVTDKQHEVRQEMAKFQNKIMSETQQHELAMWQATFQSLLL
ncbi:synaptonemal complex protein 3-like [Hippopotamus amphibius kiboko]|uniref:synaptonemal complex protein 3-like n=1 Tax=Hippopotamus amphibius kiboko TaxID=575201 RepID=UPI002596373F|nr:synaptonemal complex protein 3-like [Hippopotamus amphibius kiboko]